MARYTATIHSPKTAEDVFEYMAAFDNVSEWDPSASEAHAIDGNPPGTGARFHVVAGFMGRDIPLDYETTAFERPRRVVLRAESSTTVSEDTVTVVPARGGGCDMTYDANLAFKGPLGLLDPLFALAFKRLGDRAADGLRRELG